MLKNPFPPFAHAREQGCPAAENKERRPLDFGQADGTTMQPFWRDISMNLTQKVKAEEVFLLVSVEVLTRRAPLTPGMPWRTVRSGHLRRSTRPPLAIAVRLALCSPQPQAGHVAARCGTLRCALWIPLDTWASWAGRAALLSCPCNEARLYRFIPKEYPRLRTTIVSPDALAFCFLRCAS